MPLGVSTIAHVVVTPVQNFHHKLVLTEGGFSLHTMSSANAILQDLGKAQMKKLKGNLFTIIKFIQASSTMHCCCPVPKTTQLWRLPGKKAEEGQLFYNV